MLDFGIALKIKLCWQLIIDNSLWSRFMKMKYVTHCNIWDDSNWAKNARSLGNVKDYIGIIKTHSILLVGNGQLGDIWDDNWCGIGPIREQGNLSSSHRNSISILKDISFAYDLNLQDSLNAITSELNMQVSVPAALKFNDQPDVWAWTDDTHGKFHVKSAWNIVRHKEPEDDYCKIMWKLKAPKDCILFSWKLRRKAVAVDSRIKSLGIPMASRCVLCFHNEETIQHLMVNCPFALDLWNQVSTQLHFNVINDEHVCTRINRIFRSYVHNDMYGYILRLAAVFTPWFLWKERCKRLHDGVKSSVQSLVFQMFMIFRDLAQIHVHPRPVNPFLIYIIEDLGFNSNPPALPPPKFVKWFPPDNNTLKLNIDGASRGNPGISGGGYIIRNHKDNVLAFGSSFYGVATNMEAELRALYDGLKMIMHFEFHTHYFVIETDSQVLVKARNSKSWQWRTWYYWAQIDEMLKSLNPILVHILREANSAADFLTNLGINNSFCNCSNNPLMIPKVLKGIIMTDKIGLGRFRL